MVGRWSGLYSKDKGNFMNIKEGGFSCPDAFYEKRTELGQCSS